MIDITNVSRRFGTKAALTDVSFSAPDGSVTGFVGPNGAEAASGKLAGEFPTPSPGANRAMLDFAGKDAAQVRVIVKTVKRYR